MAHNASWDVRLALRLQEIQAWSALPLGTGVRRCPLVLVSISWQMLNLVNFFWEPIQDIFSLGSIFVTIVLRIFWEPTFLAGLPVIYTLINI